MSPLRARFLLFQQTRVLARCLAVSETQRGQCKAINCHRLQATLANHRPAFSCTKRFQDGKPVADWLVIPAARTHVLQGA